MRIFGSESMTNMLEKLGLKDGESIDHPWINKALERAQQKVEARNFDIRKTLIKFDNVLNDQRHVIFSQRNDVINSKEIFRYSQGFLDDVIDDLSKIRVQNIGNLRNNDFKNKLKTIIGKNFIEEEFNKLVLMKDNDLKKKINEQFEKSRNQRKEILGEQQSKEIEKRIFLQSIDQNWKSHIQYLEQLRQVVGLRSYGQRDPLIEYKREAFELFSNLLDKLKFDYITILMNLKVIIETKEEKNSRKEISKSGNPKCLLFIKKDQKISRNERCEATGKKFKNCCGAL